jgi:hypothetical protein
MSLLNFKKGQRFVKANLYHRITSVRGLFYSYPRRSHRKFPMRTWKATHLISVLLKKFHVSLAEGVSSESIIEYGKDYDIPNSDAFNAEPLNRWDHWDVMQLRMEEDSDGIAGSASVKNFKF